MAKSFYCGTRVGEKKVVEFLEKNGYCVKTLRKFLTDMGVDKKYWINKKNRSMLSRKICISGPCIYQECILKSLRNCIELFKEDPNYDNIKYKKNVFGVKREYVPHYYLHFNEIIEMFGIESIFSKIIYRKFSPLDHLFSEYNYVTNQFEDFWNDLSFINFKL